MVHFPWNWPICLYHTAAILRPAGRKTFLLLPGTLSQRCQLETWGTKSVFSKQHGRRMTKVNSLLQLPSSSFRLLLSLLLSVSSVNLLAKNRQGCFHRSKLLKMWGHICCKNHVDHQSTNITGKDTKIQFFRLKRFDKRNRCIRDLVFDFQTFKRRKKNKSTVAHKGNAAN